MKIKNDNWTARIARFSRIDEHIGTLASFDKDTGLGRADVIIGDAQFRLILGLGTGPFPVEADEIEVALGKKQTPPPALKSQIRLTVGTDKDGRPSVINWCSQTDWANGEKIHANRKRARPLISNTFMKRWKKSLALRDQSSTSQSVAPEPKKDKPFKTVLFSTAARA